MRIRASLVLLSVLLASIFTLGCFEIEQSIELDRDMSGTADLEIGIDFEPMILVMATMQRQMEGKEGPPSEEDLAKARAEFKSQNASPDDDLPSIEEANEKLPEGIRLLDMKVDENDLNVSTHFKFAFDELKKLVGLQLPSKDDVQKQGIMDSPFENLELVEEGDTFTIRTKPSNPTESVEQQVADQGAEPDPAMEKMMEDAFSNLRFTWKIKAPFEVVSHNATRVDGDTLIWEFDMERFKQMESAGDDDEIGVQVTYRK